jgi:uncharacterized protein YjbI with pentapeptide repeats
MNAYGALWLSPRLWEADLAGAEGLPPWMEKASVGGKFTADKMAEVVRSGWRDLKGADLRGVDLNGLDLQGADFRYADLSGAKLAGADLRGSDWLLATAEGADLSGAKWDGANLSGARMAGAKLDAAIRPLAETWGYQGEPEWVEGTAAALPQDAAGRESTKPAPPARR